MNAPRLATALVAAILAVAVGAGSGPAAAQTDLGCPPDLGLDAALAQAPTAFTGTVAALGNNGRQATVDVISIWRGGPLPRRVEVQGTIATQAKVVTALDRLYARQRTYLFLPTAGTSPYFRENRCSATREFTAEVAALAPAGGGGTPQGAGLPLPGRGLGQFLPLMIGVPAFVVMSGLLLGARRRTKRTARPAGA